MGIRNQWLNVAGGLLAVLLAPWSEAQQAMAKHPGRQTDAPPVRGMRPATVEVCDWYGCRSGAASISVDDASTACRGALDKNDFQGTYYLAGTRKFTKNDWALWSEFFRAGHEIGGHSQNHHCYPQAPLSKETMEEEARSNKEDILRNIPDMTPAHLTTFAWPCGITDEAMRAAVAQHYLSARGYHTNRLEEKDPSDMLNLRSLNTPNGYHETSLKPPSYLEMADLAERDGKWVNFVFHTHCDEHAVDYLRKKDLWVAPVGAVTKYIIARQKTSIKDLVESRAGVTFRSVSGVDEAMYDQHLTMRVRTSRVASAVLVDGVRIPYDQSTQGLTFDVPAGDHKIDIIIGRTGKGPEVQPRR